MSAFRIRGHDVIDLKKSPGARRAYLRPKPEEIEVEGRRSIILASCYGNKFLFSDSAEKPAFPGNDA
jgi:hypothetical protein